MASPTTTSKSTADEAETSMEAVKEEKETKQEPQEGEKVADEEASASSSTGASNFKTSLCQYFMRGEQWVKIVPELSYLGLGVNCSGVRQTMAARGYEQESKY